MSQAVRRKRRKFSPEEITLVQAIHENPHEHEKRMAYADWLAMDGQSEYAQFVRYQLQTRTPLKIPCPAPNTLARWKAEPEPVDVAERMRRRLAIHFRAWAGSCPGNARLRSYFLGLPVVRVHWWIGRYGMYHTILSGSSPSLRFHICLNDDVETLRRELSHPIFTRVHSLSLSSAAQSLHVPIKDDAILTLASWPGVQRLHAVTIWGVSDDKAATVRDLFPLSLEVECIAPTPWFTTPTSVSIDRDSPVPSA